MTTDLTERVRALDPAPTDAPRRKFYLLKALGEANRAAGGDPGPTVVVSDGGAVREARTLSLRELEHVARDMGVSVGR